MTILDSFARCTRSRPCPVCGRPDWCLVARDGSGAVCARVESGRRRWGEAGWYHRIGETVAEFRPMPRPAPTYHRHEPWTTTVTRYRSDLNGSGDRLAGLLGLPLASLLAVGLGWSAEHGAWSFPMRPSLVSDPCGVRLRGADGRKWAVIGSKQGIIVPEVRHGDGPVVIVEGPTDAAAAVALGFDAIGRPSCRGCEVETVAACRDRVAWIVCDADGPGIEGAASLAAAMVRGRCRCKLVMPGGQKDLRDWVRAGATAEDLRAQAADSGWCK